MKQLLLFLCCFASHLSAQQLELSAGANLNQFFRLPGGEVPGSAFKNGYGYTVGISQELAGKIPMRFTLQLDHYEGNIHLREGGLGGAVITRADISRSSVMLGVFPLNFTLLKRLHINLGLAMQALIYDGSKGYRSYWGFGASGEDIRFEDRPAAFAQPVSFGLISRLGYSIPLGNKWSLVPQYMFGMGISDEFKQLHANVKSMRHYLCIGVSRQLNTEK